MRKFLQSALLAAAIIASPLAAHAGDREDVMAVTSALWPAVQAGDAAALDKMIAKGGFSEFPGRGKGRLLIHWDASTIAAAVKGGLHSNVQFLYPEVTMLGPDAALVTGYRFGQVYQGDKPTEPFTVRGTIVYQKQGGLWKVVHMHFSPLVPES